MLNILIFLDACKLLETLYAAASVIAAKHYAINIHNLESTQTQQTSSKAEHFTRLTAILKCVRTDI